MIVLRMKQFYLQLKINSADHFELIFDIVYCINDCAALVFALVLIKA